MGKRHQQVYRVGVIDSKGDLRWTWGKEVAHNDGRPQVLTPYGQYELLRPAPMRVRPRLRLMRVPAWIVQQDKVFSASLNGHNPPDWDPFKLKAAMDTAAWRAAVTSMQALRGRDILMLIGALAAIGALFLAAMAYGEAKQAADFAETAATFMMNNPPASAGEDLTRGGLVRP